MFHDLGRQRDFFCGVSKDAQALRVETAAGQLAFFVSGIG